MESSARVRSSSPPPAVTGLSSSINTSMGRSLSKPKQLTDTITQYEADTARLSSQLASCKEDSARVTGTGSVRIREHREASEVNAKRRLLCLLQGACNLLQVSRC
ncbi:hypothetical protein J6590_086125 [Homalodisca vitripennis]|nr:hypothetical protein J6590_086125 [Homalodisca vitripennis]